MHDGGGIIHMHMHGILLHMKKKKSSPSPYIFEKGVFFWTLRCVERETERLQTEEAGLGGRYLVGTGTSCVGKTCAQLRSPPSAIPPKISYPPLRLSGLRGLQHLLLLSRNLG